MFLVQPASNNPFSLYTPSLTESFVGKDPHSPILNYESCHGTRTSNCPVHSLQSPSWPLTSCQLQIDIDHLANSKLIFTALQHWSWHCQTQGERNLSMPNHCSKYPTTISLWSCHWQLKLALERKSSPLRCFPWLTPNPFFPFVDNHPWALPKFTKINPS